MLFFFFQAEDGIRDLYVTGVQTCALPISLFALLGAGLGNNFRIDISENGRRLPAIEIGISGSDESDRAVLRQKFDWFLVPECPQHACELLFCDRLKRAMQWK